MSSSNPEPPSIPAEAEAEAEAEAVGAGPTHLEVDVCRTRPYHLSRHILDPWLTRVNRAMTLTLRMGNPRKQRHLVDPISSLLTLCEGGPALL